MASKPFPKGTLVRQTAKFRRSVGAVTGGPIDGIVLGTDGKRNLIAWSDGYSGIWQPEVLEKTRRQLSPAEAKVLVEAERARLFETFTKLTDYTRAEIAEIARIFNGSNPGNSKQGRALEEALGRAVRKRGR